ncbi:MAG: AMP-binding protein, partial [Micromonosporaceae bacterium]
QNYEMTFDPFFRNIIVACQNAGTLVLAKNRENILIDTFVNARGITHWLSVPSMIDIAARLGHLRPGRLASLEMSVFGGEPLKPASLATWVAAAPKSALVNSYGPTEVTISCAWNPLSAEDAESDRVSLPIGGFLDGVEHRTVWNATESGYELCVRGPQRFAGYLDPEDNEGKFFRAEDVEPASSATRTPAPATADPSQGRWFRTGDLVKEVSPGIFECLGRTDRQVKLSGHRVSLHEVERALLADTAVSSAYATVHSGQIAVVVAPVAGKAPDWERIKSSLRPYARPSVTITVEEFPRLPNGKVSFRGLEEIVERRAPRRPVQRHRHAT